LLVGRHGRDRHGTGGQVEKARQQAGSGREDEPRRRPVAKSRQSRHRADDGVAPGDEGGEAVRDEIPGGQQARYLHRRAAAGAKNPLGLDPAARGPHERRDGRPPAARQTGDRQELGDAPHRPLAGECPAHVITTISRDDPEMQPRRLGDEVTGHTNGDDAPGLEAIHRLADGPPHRR